MKVLENKLNEAEGTIADLKIKLSFKDDQLKQKDEYIAERIEYHEYQNTRSISIKTENKETFTFLLFLIFGLTFMLLSFFILLFIL